MDTMGSCGIGRAEISTILSAANPGALIVHDTRLFAIHVMYCLCGEFSYLVTSRNSYRIVKS